ncbi:hypothetical protein HPB48_023568 [Haemaphysalis longicornis]|uniref:Uncharacterized protein n=1 Tax=Haemaphysalis longicornis TaxID=44386 RepID=A0A9J6H888_HAELO|nr:hypothetical protein HPB48_023568 [Haemaphysalis longicornis]
MWVGWTCQTGWLAFTPQHSVRKNGQPGPRPSLLTLQQETLGCNTKKTRLFLECQERHPQTARVKTSLAHYLLSKDWSSAESDEEPPRKLLKAKVVPLPPEPKRTAKTNHKPELVNQGFA